MHSSGEENIKEDDEVILELDMSSNNPIAKAKRNVSNRSTLPCIVILCCFMICAFGSLVIVLVAQMAAIPDAPATWAAMSLSSSTPNAIPLCSIRSLDLHFFIVQVVFREPIFAQRSGSINLSSTLQAF
jgi:hypothetical protein